jgi:hypothetical protein
VWKVNISIITRLFPMSVLTAHARHRDKWLPADLPTHTFASWEGTLNATLRLKKTLKEAQNASFYDYVTNLNRHDTVLYGDQLNQLPSHCQLILRSQSHLPLQDRGQEATKRRLTCLPITLQKCLHPMTIYTTRK